jgi:hypothetical protein
MLRRKSRSFGGVLSAAGSRIVTTVCLVAGLAMLAGGTPLVAQDDQVRLALDNLVAAYPDALAGHDGKVLRWRDGL